MRTQKEWIIFFAGAEAFHTLSHALLYFSGQTFSFYSILVTQQLNLWGTLINGFITVWLLWWAARIK